MNFNTNKEDMELIDQICIRGFELLKQSRVYRDKFSMIMDLSAVHSNGNPLRLKELLGADDFNFYHDVSGIARHLNRNTGKLEHCFVPRFSVPQEKSAE